MDEKSTRTVYNLAIFITLGSGVLYVYGGFAWVAYFRYFGIHLSFMDLTFHQIIVSTWPFVFLFVFIPFYFTDRGKNEKKLIDRVSISAYSIIMTVFSSAIVLAAVRIFDIKILIPTWIKMIVPTWLCILIAIFTLIILVFPKYFRNKLEKIFNAFNFKLEIKRIYLNEYLRDTRKKIFYFAFAFFLMLMFSFYVGEIGANRIKLNSNSDRITIKVSDEEKQPPEEAILIAHMKNRYFICEPVKENEKPKTMIINDSDVISVEIIKK
jgi:hypothetical protein